MSSREKFAAAVRSAVDGAVDGIVHETVKTLKSMSLEEITQVLHGDNAPLKKRALAAAESEDHGGKRGRRKKAAAEAKTTKKPNKKPVKAAKGKAPKAAPPKVKAAKSESRRSRRSGDEVAALTKRVVDLVGKSPDGIGISDLSTKLKVDKDDLVFPLQMALKDGHIRKTGEKRNTRYLPKVTNGAAKEMPEEAAAEAATEEAPAQAS